jgi:hypothetical protein
MSNNDKQFDKLLNSLERHNALSVLFQLSRDDDLKAKIRKLSEQAGGNGALGQVAA